MALTMNAPSAPTPARSTPPTHVVLVALKWIRRLGALLFAGLLGAFFIEHIGEWYTHPDQGFPPAWVGGVMLAHLAMIIGLLTLLRWERLGSLITVLGTLAFLGIFALARHTMHLPYIVLYCLAPVGIVALEWALARLTRDSGGR